MENKTYTEDIVDFGIRERRMAAKIFALPMPDGFYDDQVRLGFNMNLGYVFLTNSDCQVAMINSSTGKLELWHSTPYNGHEGFLNDLLEEFGPDDLNVYDIEYLRDAAKREGVELFGKWSDEE